MQEIVYLFLIVFLCGVLILQLNIINDWKERANYWHEKYLRVKDENN